MDERHISLQTSWDAIQQSSLSSIQNSFTTLGEQVNLLEQHAEANEDNVQKFIARVQQLLERQLIVGLKSINWRTETDAPRVC